MEPKGAPTGPPAPSPGAGDPVRIWFRVGLACSPPPNGLVGDGALRPAEEREWMGSLECARGHSLQWGGGGRGGEEARSGVSETGKKSKTFRAGPGL